MTKNSLKIFIATSMLMSSTALAADFPVGMVREEVNEWKKVNGPKVDVDNSGDTKSVSGKKGSVAVTKDYNTDGTLNSESVNTYKNSSSVSRSESYQKDTGVISTNVKGEEYSRSSTGYVQDGAISSKGNVVVEGEEYDTTSSITKNGDQEADIKVDYNGQEKDGWIKSTTNSDGSKTLRTSGGRSKNIKHQR